MNPPADPHVDTRNRNRWMLIALFAMFFGAMFVAGVLRFSGWRPHGMKNKGELLQPYADLRTLTPRLADGSEYRWNPAARTWRIAAMPRDCTNAAASQCEALLRQLDTVWQLAGKDADRVDLLWIGDLPADGPRPASLRQLKPDMALRDRLPGADDRDRHAGLRDRSERFRGSALRSRLRSRRPAHRPVPFAETEMR